MDTGRSNRPRHVLVLSRPHNWRPRTVKEELLEIDLLTGAIVLRRPLNSRHARRNTLFILRDNRDRLSQSEEKAI